MKYQEYLKELLGEKQVGELRAAIKDGKTIIVSGNQCTGKTTLVSVLKEHGCSAVEDFDTYEVILSKPLNCKIPKIKDTIS